MRVATQNGFNRTVTYTAGPAMGLSFTRVWSNAQFDRALFDEGKVQYRVNPECETLLEAAIGSGIRWSEPVDSGLDEYLIAASLFGLSQWLEEHGDDNWQGSEA